MGKLIVLNKWKGGGVTMNYTMADLDLKVKDLLTKYNMTDIPVDPIQLANLMGIEVQEGEFTDSSVSGVLRIEDGKSTIIVNKDHHYNRKRFTVAHEIGHVVLGHRPKNQDFAEIYRNGKSNSKEQQANQFAAALLVDKADLLESSAMLKKCGIPREKIIVALADKYKVSTQTLRYRLDNIGGC